MQNLSSSDLPIQEKEKITNYNKKNVFNTLSLICKVFQYLSQIPISELMNMKINDHLSKKKVNYDFYALKVNLKFKHKKIYQIDNFSRRITMSFL